MEQMTSTIKGDGVSTATTGAAARAAGEGAFLKTREQRAKTVPTVGVVSNFDPDQREFLTAPFKGFTSLQVGPGEAGGTFGTLAVQADYTPAITQQEAEGLGIDFNERATRNRARLLPRQGYPALIFPVAGNGPAANTSFIRGGKADDLKRAYPVRCLTKAFTVYNFGDTSDPTGLTITYAIGGTVVVHPDLPLVLAPGVNLWDENSPLPPGVRYFELQDLWSSIQIGIASLPIQPGNPAPTGEDVSADISTYLHVPDTSILLPRDSLGNIRENRVTLPAESWWHLSEVYLDDTLWTGEVTDPLTWVELDSTWQSIGLTRDVLSTFLDAHPGAKLS